MKSRILTCITAMTLFAAPAVPVRLAQEHRQKQPPYTVTFGTLGGTFGESTGVNNRGCLAFVCQI